MKLFASRATSLATLGCAAAALVLVVACGGNKRNNRTSSEQDLTCEISDDCPPAMLCRGGSCIVEDGCETAGTCGGDGPVTGGDGDGDTSAGDNDSSLPPATVRFVAIGDTGKGNQGQQQVANAIVQKCTSAGGCNFGLLLGDNFYPSGVSSIDDPQWQSAFEVPYAGVTFPMYAVLGNHDYGADGAGTETWKGPLQVDYAREKTTVFKMPATYYTFTVGNVGFVVLDTNSILFNQAADQRAWYAGALAGLGTEWAFVAGHHPFRSNGKHGNAGSYDGYPWIPMVNGEHIKSFYEELVCSTNDFYLSGHDHSLQWLVGDGCGAELVVSGAGATTTAIEGDNPAHFEASELGFFYAEVQGNRFTGQFIDVNGVVKYQRTVTR